MGGGVAGHEVGGDGRRSSSGAGSGAVGRGGGSGFDEQADSAAAGAGCQQRWIAMLCYAMRTARTARTAHLPRACTRLWNSAISAIGTATSWPCSATDSAARGRRRIIHCELTAVACGKQRQHNGRQAATGKRLARWWAWAGAADACSRSAGDSDDGDDSDTHPLLCPALRCLTRHPLTHPTPPCPPPAARAPPPR